MLKKSLPIAKMLFSENKAKELCYLSHKRFLLNKTNFPNEFGNVNFLILSRNYAKGKDIKKDKKKKTYIDEKELEQYVDIEKLFKEINKPLESFKKELIDHVSLRTSQGTIENIKIEFDGNTYTIQDLAEVGKKPNLCILDFSAFPQMIPTVLATLQNSELNLNAQQEGYKLMIPIPKVTKDHREVLAKKAKGYFVKCKDSVRDVQMKYIKNVKNAQSINDHIKFRISDQLTALGDKQISMAEELLKTKCDELLKKD